MRYCYQGGRNWFTNLRGLSLKLPSRLRLWNTPTVSLQRGKPPPPPNECPDMTLNSLMVRFQWCWGFGVCRSTPLLPSLPGPLWPGVVAFDKGSIYGLNRTNGILMLNWIVWVNWIAWNRNVFDNQTVLTFKLRVYAKLNYFK